MGDFSERSLANTEHFLYSVSIRLFAGSPRHQTHFKDFPPDVKIEIIITTRMVTDESLTVAPAFSRCCLFLKISKLH